MVVESRIARVDEFEVKEGSRSELRGNMENNLGDCIQYSQEIRKS